MAERMALIDRVRTLIDDRSMVRTGSPVLLMVSGGSDSTALAYAAAELRDEGRLGTVTMLHVNHKLRGEASDGDAAFTRRLSAHLGIPLFDCEIDVPALLANGGNMEATAREERYRAVREALESTCSHTGYDLEDASAFTGHTADDRVESYFMRTIVGTGPGGLRAMSHVSWVNGCRICRPLLECSRDELREYIRSRPGAIADELGNLWREDATNGDTDHFRSYVRHELVPRAMERNPQLLATLTRTMNQIADEDDMLIARTKDLLVRFGVPLGSSPREGFIMSPEIGMEPKAMQRRVVYRLLSLMLPPTARIESASVEACVEAIGNHGYVANIQGDIAVSFNKHGLRLEPMAAFRARRNRV